MRFLQVATRFGHPVQRHGGESEFNCVGPPRASFSYRPIKSWTRAVLVNKTHGEATGASLASLASEPSWSVSACLASL